MFSIIVYIPSIIKYIYILYSVLRYGYNVINLIIFYETTLNSYYFYIIIKYYTYYYMLYLSKHIYNVINIIIKIYVIGVI